MTKRNPNFDKLSSSYLFPEIQKRKRIFLESNPDAKLISLGIGDTTEPIAAEITQEMAKIASELSTPDGYRGYGNEPGLKELREAISHKIYKGKVPADAIFISDGAKCDIGRLQTLFGQHVRIAVQDPTYPVYVDGSLLNGVENTQYMACNPENDFFPDLDLLKDVDILYFCSPNNPTGSVCTFEQLSKLVRYALEKKCFLVFDSAYSSFIQDSDIPSSIYDIEGAKEVAIEINSFSKLAGFTGVRLGWTVVPSELKYEDGKPVQTDWNRIVTTLFNGASILSQCGALVALQDKIYEKILKTNQFYLENAKLLRECFENLGFKVYGGIHAPYLWVHFEGFNSWDTFQYLLENFHIITTPGSGFGKMGEGFIRVSAFGKRENILDAISRLSAKELLLR